MSLDDLLSKPDPSSPWKDQQRKLIQIIGVVIAVTVALVVLSLAFLSGKKESVPPAADQTDSIARLMRLQDETRKMQKQIRADRRIASAPRAARPSGEPDRVVNFDPGEGFREIAVQKREIYIPTGAVFQAQLITPIKTSVQRTFVMAETTREFRMDMQRRIPNGSRLIGRSRLNPVLKGVIVEFETLVLPNGRETNLSSLALSRNALPEIDGLYFSDDLQNYGTALAFGFLSGFANAARERETTIFGSVPEVNVNNQLLAGLSTASFQVAEEILRDIRNRAVEYVVVPAGERIFVALTRRYDIQSGDQK